MSEAKDVWGGKTPSVIPKIIGRVEKMLPWGWEAAKYKDKNFSQEFFPCYKATTRKTSAYLIEFPEQISLYFVSDDRQIRKDKTVPKDSFVLCLFVEKAWRPFAKQLNDRANDHIKKAKEYLETLDSVEIKL